MSVFYYPLAQSWSSFCGKIMRRKETDNKKEQMSPRRRMRDTLDVKLYHELSQGKWSDAQSKLCRQLVLFQSLLNGMANLKCPRQGYAICCCKVSIKVFCLLSINTAKSPIKLQQNAGCSYCCICSGCCCQLFAACGWIAHESGRQMLQLGWLLTNKNI